MKYAISAFGLALSLAAGVSAAAPAVKAVPAAAVTQLKTIDTVVGKGRLAVAGQTVKVHYTGWLYEPKWDGFRALIFWDGQELVIQSRDLRPLGRYFPELEAGLKAALPAPCVLDGELVTAALVYAERLPLDGVPGIIGPALDVPASAPPQTRLLARFGRRG